MKKAPPVKESIESVLKAGDGYPDPAWLSNYCKITYEDAAEAIQAHKDGTDWGTLEQRDIHIQMHETDSTTAKEKPLYHSVHDLPKNILKAIFAILALLAAARSFGFIYGWFVQWDNWFYSLVMAAMLVGCSVTMPQALVLTIRENRKVLAVMSLFLVIVTIAFSMVCTSGGLYNDRSQKLTVTKTSQIEMERNRAIIASLDSDEQRILSDKESDTRELGLLQSKMEQSVTGTYEYNRSVNRIDSIKGRIDSYNKRLDVISEKKKSIDLQQVAIERNDFFTFLASIFGVRQEEIEFLSLVVISIIVDIAGPILAALAIFL